MYKSLLTLALTVPVALSSGPQASAQCCKDGGEKEDAPSGSKAPNATARGGFLSPYFAIWRALGKDELKGVPEAKKALTSALRAALKTAPKGTGDRDRARRAKLLASAEAAASKIETSDLKKAREGFGVLSGELRKLVEAFPAEADAYVVYCDMAKKGWLQDTPEVLNPYYGASMATCGKVVHKPGSPAAKARPGEGSEEEKPSDPHAGRAGH